MDTRTLGQTGLLVSRLGLGLAALGRPGYINLGHADDLRRRYDVPDMEANAHAVLDAAWQAGFRYLDAARSYGRSEEFLGRWLTARNIPPSSVTVGSKWGYTYTAGWNVRADKHEVKEHSLTVLRRQIAETRALVGEHLDLYQVHSATLDSGLLDNRDVLDELSRLRDTGLAIGLTLSGPEQTATLRKAMTVSVGGERLFSCVQATWNVLEPSAGPVLQAAHAAGMGVIVKEALANGRLTQRNDDPVFAPRRRILEEIAGRRKTTLDALALAAVLAQPWADVVLSGAATVEQLSSNVKALEIHLADSDRHALSGLAENPSDYWAIRSLLAWN
jgi:aryl-alcohol dehydrogenase-like predicted oxidoreductase